MNGSVLKDGKVKVRHEGMRIGGEKVFTDNVIEVLYPLSLIHI